jgi:hypothetical protein
MLSHGWSEPLAITELRGVSMGLTGDGKQKGVGGLEGMTGAPSFGLSSSYIEKFLVIKVSPCFNKPPIHHVC